MTCREIEQNLPAYLEDLLSEEEKTEIREHLAACRDCRQALEDLKGMERLLANLEEVTPPPWMKSKIMAQVREEAQAKAKAKKGFFRTLSALFTPWRLKIPLQTLALLLITVLAVYLYRGEEPELRKEGIVIAPPAATSVQDGARRDGGKKEKPSSGPAVPSGTFRQEAPLPSGGLPPGKEVRPEQPQPPANADLARDEEFPTQRASENGGEGKGDRKQEMVCAEPADASKAAPLVEGLGSSPAPARRCEIAAAPTEEKDDGSAALSSPPSARAGFRAGESKMKAASGPAVQGADRRRIGQALMILLRDFDAEQIEAIPSGEGEVVKAIVPSRQVKPLLRKLEALGIPEKSVSFGAPDPLRGTVEIRISRSERVGS